jgi:hypothetical protein
MNAINSVASYSLMTPAWKRCQPAISVAQR